MRRGLLLAFGAGVALILSGCAGGADAPDSINVSMKDDFFSREVVRIGVGDTVRFVNDGRVPHNAIDVEGRWSTGLTAGGDLRDLMDPGERVSITFDEPGVYPFFCSLHAPDDASSGMVGTLVVGDVEFTGLSPDAPAEPVREWTGQTRRVPQDHPTIQNAVDAADPGDLILIDPAPQDDTHRAPDGSHVYREQVDVRTPYLTIRGTDRNAVIIDGEHQRPNGIAVTAANGVAVENLTVRNTIGNGIYWNAVTGYRGSYLTAHNNAVYGIYAYDSQDGLFEHSYASGSGDAGFYIGQCNPCDGIVSEVMAERNGLGYSGTNSSDVFIVNSVWRHNSTGIVPNSLDSQRFPPFGRVTVVGNLVHDNDSREAPMLRGVYASFGNGVMLAGGLDSLVERNRIVNHERSGVVISPNLSRNFWMSGGNVVRGNVIEASGYGDIVLAGPAMGGHCFADNDAARTRPAGLQTLAGCGDAATAGAHVTAATPDRGRVSLPTRQYLPGMMISVGLIAEVTFDRNHQVDSASVPAPPHQPQMPGGADAPVVPAVDVFDAFGLDLASYEVPDMPGDVAPDRPASMAIAGVPLGLGGYTFLYGLLGWILPFGLFAAWVAMAAVDIARRTRPELAAGGGRGGSAGRDGAPGAPLSRGAAAGWMAAVFVVPFLGAPAYLLGPSTWSRRLVWGVVVGGFVIVLGLVATAAIVGGLL